MRIRWPLWWYRICAYMSRAQLHPLSQWNLSFSDHMFVFWQYQRILKLAELFLRQQAFELWRTEALDWLGMANVLASTWKHDPLLCSFWRGTFDPNLTGTNWNQFNGEWWGPLKIRYVHKLFEEGFTWIFRCSHFFALSMIIWVQHEDICLTHFIPFPNFIWGNRVTPGLTAFPVITNFRLDPCRWWPMITSAGMGLSLRTGAGRRLGCWSIWFWCFCWVWPWRTLGFRFVFRLVFCFDADLELGC